MFVLMTYIFLMAYNLLIFSCYFYNSKLSIKKKEGKGSLFIIKEDLERYKK